jgi:hypothetical protein
LKPNNKNKILLGGVLGAAGAAALVAGILAGAAYRRNMSPNLPKIDQETGSPSTGMSADSPFYNPASQPIDNEMFRE